MAAISAAAESIRCEVLLGKKGLYLQQSESKFAPNEKILAKVKIADLKPGQYSFLTEWINPEGKLEDQSTFSFEQKKQEDFTAQAWLQLIRASFFQRMGSVTKASGYPAKFYGQWQVNFYLNGEKIASQQFEIM